MPVNFPNSFEIAEDAGFQFDEGSENQIADFFKEILAYLGLVEQSSVSSMKVGDAGKQLYKSFVRLFGNADPVDISHFSISEIHNNLQINDVQLSVEIQNKPVVAAFLFFMLENNLLKIRFERSIPHSQFIKLLNQLWLSDPSADLEEILKNDNVVLAQVERQVHIPTTSIDESNVDIFEDESTISSIVEADIGEVEFHSETAVQVESGEEIDSTGKREKTEDAEGVRIRRFIVKVTVGDHPLQGAKVQLNDGVRPIMKMTDLDGALIELTPGEYDVQISFEQYRIDKHITIPYDDRETVLVVDFQSIFEF
jgi:hypothetical protein